MFKSAPAHLQSTRIQFTSMPSRKSAIKQTHSLCPRLQFNPLHLVVVGSEFTPVKTPLAMSRETGAEKNAYATLSLRLLTELSQVIYNFYLPTANLGTLLLSFASERPSRTGGLEPPTVEHSLGGVEGWRGNRSATVLDFHSVFTNLLMQVCTRWNMKRVALFHPMYEASKCAM